jgi:hypothetical protein
MRVRLCRWRRGIAATDTNLTVYPPPSFEFIERSPGPPGFSFDRQTQGGFEKTADVIFIAKNVDARCTELFRLGSFSQLLTFAGATKPLKESAMMKKLVALAFCAAFGLTSFSALAEEDHHHHYYHHHYYHHDYHHHDHHDDHHM